MTTGPIERALIEYVNLRPSEDWVVEQCRISDRTLVASSCAAEEAVLEKLLAHVQGAMSSVCKYLSYEHSWATASGFERKVFEALRFHGFNPEK